MSFNLVVDLDGDIDNVVAEGVRPASQGATNTHPSLDERRSPALRLGHAALHEQKPRHVPTSA